MYTIQTIAFILLLSIVHSLDCASNQVYAKIIKKTTTYANEESFKILTGTTVEYTSPILTNNQERTLEVCLSEGKDAVYSLVMMDSANDAWSDGAWIAIQDINDHVVFKGMMSERSSETVDFALYSPIHKNEQWKMGESFQEGWNQVVFDDSAWSSVTCGSTSQQSSGTLYFRKTFVGITDMAAVDIQFHYAHGILAFINGVEVFRDNLPSGAISHTTPASGSYTASDYHGVIRPASVAESGESVLAVELHFVDSSSRPIDFNAFLSYGAGISSDNKCFVSYASVTASGSGITNPNSAFDFTRNSGASGFGFPKEIVATFNANVVPMVSGIRFWPNSNPDASASTFTLSGSSDAGSTWTPILSPVGQSLSSMSWKQYTSIAAPVLYKSLKLTVESTKSSSMLLYEVQFLVCSDSSSELRYPQSSYSFYARHDSIDLHVDTFGITSCQSSPSLPAGVTIDSQCTISGAATVASPQTVYTITGSSGARTVSGTLTLSFIDCQGTLLRIVRTYDSDASSEAFRIRDSSNDAILMEVPIGHSNPPYQAHVDYLCVTVDRFDVSLESTKANWYRNSYIYMYASLADGEEDLILKARFDANQHNDNTYWLRRESITISEQWYYKMGEVPANWYDDNTSGWSQANRGTFPASTNQIQLYKKTFSVSDLSVVSGLILNIRYKYGCVVYVNGNEAFRNHMGTEAISATTMATESYSEVKYHTVTLPGRFVNADGSNPIALLKQGSNTIAIGLFAISGQTASDFDATVRLMTNQPEAHIWEFSGSLDEISGMASYVFDGYYGTYLTEPYYTNSLTITLDNDRREWVNMVQVQNACEGNIPGVSKFKLYGRNSASEQWTLLANVTGLTYSMAAQKRSVYFVNRVPYNQFKFENFAPAAVPDDWLLQSLNLYATSVMADPSPLTYPATTSIFRDIEMSELIPESDGYYGFSISPALPQGLVIDSSNGWISGTYNGLFDPTVFTVTAHKKTGGTATAQFTLSCEICTGGKSLMTVRIRADGFPEENAWKLRQGRGVTGTVLKSVSVFPVSSNYYYLDFCLNDGLYTFEALDLFGDGWSFNHGYTLTADTGAMELEMEEMPASSDSQPKSVTTVFSTFFPFQVEYSDWKVYQGGMVEGWNGVSFDDSAWETKKAAEIVNGATVTTYIRKSFQLTNVDDYQVLNIRMKYAGGVAVYFNGNRVARFNLIDDFDANTESIAVHDATLFSKFHIVLVTAGVQEGTNVIAFEVHRPVGTSSSDPFVFDATGVFGVETCSTVIDSFASLNSTQLVTGSIGGIMDLDPFTYGTLPSESGTFIEWTVENLEGSRWNAFNLVLSSDLDLVFDLYGSLADENSSPTTLTNKNLQLQSRTKPMVSVPVALAGFSRIRYEILQSNNPSSIGAMFTAYCKASGAVCPGIDNYPSVAEGQISPGPCNDGFSGYSYRTCSGGVLGEVQMDKCSYKTPTNVRYRSTRYTFVMGIASTTGLPTYRNIVTRWFVDDGVELPAGLTLNEETGEISGIPTDVMDNQPFTVFARNPNGAASVTIELSVRVGHCIAEGVFPTTKVGTVAKYQCSTQGNYVGTQTRGCVLGEKDGEWQKASGFCLSYGSIVILVVVVVVVIAVVVLILMKTRGKTKAVGGVKGKTKAAGGAKGKTLTKKSATK